MEKKNVTRAEAYAEIKAKNLQKACMDKYGKNFTQCSTNDLIALIEDSQDHQPASGCPRAKMFKEEPKGNLSEAFKALVNVLYQSDYLEVEDYEDIMSELEGKKVTSDKMSQEEIDEMFSFVK